ncbi:hypothetical protein HHI36_012130 [Cryptolaemus montrouzieri]|uniref:THAP-type domain-containing protein n=1 Tax=Cryptolaemus montrouzieri TaxID=559131 RepID=A0ABD2NDD6_9CUCU
MVYCSAINCESSSESGPKKVRMFFFPVDPTRREKWVQNTGRVFWKPRVSSRLCEHHFEESQFTLRPSDNARILKRDAVPTLFEVRSTKYIEDKGLKDQTAGPSEVTADHNFEKSKLNTVSSVLSSSTNSQIEKDSRLTLPLLGENFSSNQDEKVTEKIQSGQREKEHSISKKHQKRLNYKYQKAKIKQKLLNIKPSDLETPRIARHYLNMAKQALKNQTEKIKQLRKEVRRSYIRRERLTKIARIANKTKKNSKSNETITLLVNI